MMVEKQRTSLFAPIFAPIFTTLPSPDFPCSSGMPPSFRDRTDPRFGGLRTAPAGGHVAAPTTGGAA